MPRSTFSQFFPPPQFLSMPAIGLDISDASLRFVELVDQGKYVTVGRFGERAIPRGVIEGGEVKKPADLRAILTEIKKTYQLERVVVALPEEKLYLFDLELPSMKKSAIRGAIELVLAEHIPLSVDEAQFDYQIKEETSESIIVHVSAAPRALIYGYLEAFEGTGIIPIVFENEALALARSVVAEDDSRAFMIVDLGRTRAGITIVSRGLVEYTSTISVGGSAITETFAKAFSVSLDAAEKIKQEQGFAHEGAVAETLFERSSPLVILRDEIRRHYAYWQTHNGQNGEKHLPIETVYLCGGEANIRGLAEYLAEGTSVPFIPPNVFINIRTPKEYVPSITFSDSLRYATAIGLARFTVGHGMANLLPAEEKKNVRTIYRLRLSAILVGAATFIAIANLALLAPSYLRAGTKEQVAEDRVTQVSGVSADEQARAGEAVREEARAFEKKTALFLRTQTVARGTYPARMISDIITLREPLVRIQSLSYDKTEIRERFVVAGISAGRDHLARFVDALKKDARFTKVEIPISSYVKTNDINFSIALEIASPKKK